MDFSRFEDLVGEHPRPEYEPVERLYEQVESIEIDLKKPDSSVDQLKDLVSQLSHWKIAWCVGARKNNVPHYDAHTYHISKIISNHRYIIESVHHKGTILDHIDDARLTEYISVLFPRS